MSGCCVEDDEDDEAMETVSQISMTSSSDPANTGGGMAGGLQEL